MAVGSTAGSATLLRDAWPAVAAQPHTWKGPKISVVATWKLSGFSSSLQAG